MIQHNQEGSIILEMSLVLPIFMFVILGIYGMFVIFSAQNQMTHALLQASRSLSLDPYIFEHVDSAGEADTMWGGLTDLMVDVSRSVANDPYYSSLIDWGDGTGDSDVAKKRFVGFLSGGDEALADEKLKNMGIEDGLSGVQIQMNISGENMTLTMDYELQFWMDAFSLGKIPVHQSIRSRLWK